MKYAAVIVTYNRVSLLKECIDHVLLQSVPFDRIVIIDNHSTDGTREYLMPFLNDGRFIIKFEDENLGGSGGFKDGIGIASDLGDDYVLIIDDDAILDENYIFECDKYIQSHPGIAAVSGTVETEGVKQLNHRRRISNMLIFAESNVPEGEYAKESFNYDMSTFCGLMVKTDVLHEIGLPLDEYFISYDDTEYSMRLKKYGGIVNVNGAVLNHKTKLTMDAGDFYSRMSWKTYYGHRNRYATIVRHCPSLTALMARAEYDVFILGAYIKGRKDLAMMLKDSKHDAVNGILGKNEKYLPSKK